MPAHFSPPGLDHYQRELAEVSAAKRTAVHGIGSATEKESSAGRNDASVAIVRGEELRRALSGVRSPVQIVEQSARVMIGTTVDVIFDNDDGASLPRTFTVGAWGERISATTGGGQGMMAPINLL